MSKIINVNNAKIFDFMKRLNFFEHFTDIELRQILNQHVQIHVYENNEYIVKIGEMTISFYIILSGSVIIVREKIKDKIIQLIGFIKRMNAETLNE